MLSVCCCVLQRVTPEVDQYVAVCCCVLQRVTTEVDQYVVSVLLCVAACYTVSQCVVVWCSVLHCSHDIKLMSMLSVCCCVF